MWSNNGFQGHGEFQQDQANFHRIYSDDGYIPFSPAEIGRQYFQNIKPTPGILYNDFMDSEQSTPGEFEPEIGLYNEESYAHNQFRSSDSMEEYIPQRQGIMAQGTPRPTLNARAEELKAQLLKSKERAKSGTPPVFTTTVDPKPPGSEGLKTLRESPKSIEALADEAPLLSRRKPAVIDDSDFDELISQAQTVANVKRERVQSVSTSSGSQGNTMSESAIRFQTYTIEPTTTSDTPGTNADNHAQQARHKMTREESNGGASDVSEGEIKENSRTKNATTQRNTGYKETKNSTRFYAHEEPALRNTVDERSRMTVNNHETRGISPYRESSATKSRVNAPRLDGRYEDAEEKFERRNGQPNDRYEIKHKPESEQRLYPRRDSKGSSEIHRKFEICHESGNKEGPSKKSEIPTLAQLLLTDEDLKDWLDVTGYHNSEYRNKILNRRRAIAALDAQKAKLLEEMEIEERGGVPPVTKTQLSAAGMLPPPIPSKMGAAASSINTRDGENVHTDRDRSSSSALIHSSATKRSYTDHHGSQDEEDLDKVGRAEDRSREMGVRIKSGSQSEQRQHLNSPDSSRRSTSDDNKTRRQDENNTYDDDRGRDRARVYSRQHAHSPEEGHDRSPPAKFRKYDLSPPEDRDDHNEWKTRPFVMRGNYRGRAYDPNYRSRGRGRGGWNELGEVRFERRESQPTQPFGQGFAFMKPYKDPKPLDLGRKGDTKYFIVKSFNKENVVRCIEDSIWTTQIENGEIFKAAFLKYRNVILVFSVNQSRAFQGYARMESLPGSEEAPKWQNNLNWESAGAFKVRWICVANTRFHLVGHIKNSLNENLAVLVGRDGQEIEEFAGEELLKLIDEEADRLLIRSSKDSVPTLWDN